MRDPLAPLFPDIGLWQGRHVVLCNWRDGRHPAAGGAELYCEQVARRLSLAGVRVTYLTARPRGAPRSETTGHGRVVRGGGRYTVYLFVLLWLALHRRGIDAVVDSQNGLPFFAPLAVSRRTPVVLLVHHVHQQQFGLLLPPPLAALGRWLEAAGSRLVYGGRTVCTVSPSSRAQIRGDLGLRGPVHLAPPGLTPVAPAPRADRPRIVCVSRMSRQKRLDHLLEALAELRDEVPDAELHLVGDGEERHRLVRVADRLGLGDAVVFHGRLPAARRDALVASAWITALPSAREGWGLSVMEAASAGVPAVAYDVPGLRDAIRHGETGWLVPEDRGHLAPVLAHALRVVADPVRAALLAARCRAWVGRFTWNATAGHLLAALTAERARPRSPRAGTAVTDTCAVVGLPRAALRRARTEALRVTDLVDAPPDADRAGLLLAGVDESAARDVLERAGVDTSDPRVTVRLARHGDLLGWQCHPRVHTASPWAAR
ncbi:glycosyltransferase family 4 protein [Streptomyces sp. DH12]|uniref:glycosyltransferase family 4 protein n=1 Tax=Streptomyces sp. DH12 TaxID=2857010 RepID=UPI001E31469D|nr:glycosyltransferase family 4 protein [Streptomyces sp. DH12]